jgi:hypothetical protein
MRIPVLHDLPLDSAPYVSVSMDVSRVDESAGHEIELRWRLHQQALTRSGASERVLDRIGARLTAPTGRPGAVGRLVVAGRDEVLLDLVLPERPVREEAVLGPAPHLLPVYRAVKDHVPYILAEVDRTGADLSVVDEWGTGRNLVVEGDHDVIHKVPGGRLAHRRIQARVEDSWARNATEVARELERLVARHRPDVVLLAGDPIAVADVLDASGPAVTEIAGRLRAGHRAAGASTEARDAEIAGVLVRRARERRENRLERFQSQEGRQSAAVQSLPDVVEAARRAQIDELLLHDDPASTNRLWLGDQPLALGMSRQEVELLGARNVREIRADTALVWATLYADAGITVLDPDEGRLRDGIGAVLRWSDRSTPHDGVPSMPGHGQ